MYIDIYATYTDPLGYGLLKKENASLTNNPSPTDHMTKSVYVKTETELIFQTASKHHTAHQFQPPTKVRLKLTHL